MLFYNSIEDIVAIVNSEKEIVAEYYYDGYGNCTISDDYTSVIGSINHLRYRGYYLDDETGFYYLSSRYYDSNIGRFITKDDIEYLGVSATTVSYNLYAYCNNDPVCYSDSDGTFGLWALTGITLAASVIGGLAQMASNALSGNDLFDGVLAAAVGSGVNAVLMCYSSNIFIVSGIASLVQTGIDYLQRKNTNYEMGIVEIINRFVSNYILYLNCNFASNLLVEINPKLPQPNTFLDAFCSEYGKDLVMQDIIGAEIVLITNSTSYIIRKYRNKTSFKTCLAFND